MPKRRREKLAPTLRCYAGDMPKPRRHDHLLAFTKSRERDIRESLPSTIARVYLEVFSLKRIIFEFRDTRAEVEDTV